MGFTFEEFPNSDYYNSDLRKILKYMRQFEATLNEWEAVALDLQEKLKTVDQFDIRITALELDAVAIHQLIDGIHEDITSIRANIKTIESDIQALVNQDKVLQAEIDDINRRYDVITAEISSLHNDIKVLYRYIDASIKSLELKLMDVINNKDIENIKHFKQLEKEIQELRDIVEKLDTFVINPWHPELKKIPLQKNTNLTYADLADNCLTAEQYSKLGLTAEQYSNFKLTAYEYARFGKEKLHYWWVHSPVYGWRQDINNVLTSIMNNIKGTMSALAYSELGLTAEQYSAIGLTALEYYGWQPEREGMYVLEGLLQSDIYYLGEEDGVLEFAGVNSSVDENGILTFDS